MGLFLCSVCDEQIGFGSIPEHVCDHEKIKALTSKLRDQANAAESKLHDIKNAVFMTLQQLPSLDPEEVTIPTEWLRNLWKAAECQWYSEKTADNFLSRWIATHRTLCEAFDLFRSKKSESKLEKLQALREACDNAAELLGYQDSKLDLRPEDLV